MYFEGITQPKENSPIPKLRSKHSFRLTIPIQNSPSFARSFLLPFVKFPFVRLVRTTEPLRTGTEYFSSGMNSPPTGRCHSSGFVPGTVKPGRKVHVRCSYRALAPSITRPNFERNNVSVPVRYNSRSVAVMVVCGAYTRPRNCRFRGRSDIRVTEPWAPVCICAFGAVRQQEEKKALSFVARVLMARRKTRRRPRQCGARRRVGAQDMGQPDTALMPPSPLLITTRDSLPRCNAHPFIQLLERSQHRSPHRIAIRLVRMPERV